MITVTNCNDVPENCQVIQDLIPDIVQYVLLK